MLKSLRLGTFIAAIATTQIAFPLIAAPQKTQIPREVYMGVSLEDTSYINDVYIFPDTIRSRGDLKRYKERYVYRQPQEDVFGKYKYKQSIVYWTANCREGSSGAQKSEYYDAQGNKLGEFTSGLELKVPGSGSLNEKILDFVCDYKP